MRPGSLSSVGRGAMFVASLPLVAGCGLLFPETAPASDPAPPRSEEVRGIIALSPGEPAATGPGTLRQQEISMHLRRGELQLQVTPLDEYVILVTASDTYERLSALGRGHQAIFRDRTGSAVPFQLFLVSVYSEAAEVAFEPEALHVVNRGLRYRPAEIRAITPEWDTQRLRPRQSLMAVYAFPIEVDLEMELEVEYQEVRTRDWERILPLIQVERARLGVRSDAPPFR